MTLQPADSSLQASTTAAVKEPDGSLIRQASKQETRKRPWYTDSWMVLTMLTAYIASLAAFWYFFHTHQIILYGDAYAHILIARRIFDNVTPGFAQLGGVWLPLSHMIMLPFVWNDYLWQTGLAGSIPSSFCYLIATCYLFLTARRLTRDSRASFLGTLLFILNPNVLYLQTIALSEILLIATLAASAYYILAWAQEDRLTDLIKAGVSIFLATLSRYDGWFLFVVFLIIIVLIGRLKGHSRSRIEGNLVIFGTMGGLGIILWLAWGKLIFGDPLYFQHGPFSSQSQQISLINAHVLFTYHDLWQSIRYYTIDGIANVGLILFVLGAIAIIVFFIRHRLLSEKLASLVFLAPFVFYVIALYGGQAALYVSGAVPPNFDHQIYNARYGVELVAPAAVFVATLASSLTSIRLRTWGHVLLLIVIPLQSILLSMTGIVSLEDGQFGVSCAHSHPIILFLAQHYNGGKILEDLYDSKMDALNPEAAIDFKEIVYEGSGTLWQQALANPVSKVNWIIVNQASPYDQVAQHLTPAFNAQYTRDIEENNGLSLYHRNGLVFPTRPIPQFFLTQHALCGDPRSAQGSTVVPHSAPIWQRRETQNAIL